MIENMHPYELGDSDFFNERGAISGANFLSINTGIITFSLFLQVNVFILSHNVCRIIFYTHMSSPEDKISCR